MKPVSVPTPISPEATIWPPNHSRPTFATAMAAWNTGMFRTAPPNVCVAVSASDAFTSSKRFATCPSRTYALMARMATRSSCSVSFRRSITPCSTAYCGATWCTMSPKATARNGRITKNTTASRALMAHASTRPATSMTGLRRSGLTPITNAFWMTVMSVVRRVTSEDDSNSSRFANAYSCRWAYSASRRFAPKPMAALAEKCEYPRPQTPARSATTTIRRPVASTSARLPDAMPTSTMRAIRKGITSSATVSPMMSSVATSMSSRYPRR